MIEYVVIFVALAIIYWVWQVISKSGFLSKIEPEVTESPSNLSKPLTVYYKYNIGAYSGSVNVINEARALLPKSENVTTFGIYYDNPDVVAPHLLQSAIGVVFGADGKDLYNEEVAETLVENGFEKMVLPKVSRAVQAIQPSSGGILSILALVNRSYGIVKEYISANRLEVKYAVEFYSSSEISIEFPLDNVDDFLVPDYLPTDELESKLARKKFDSDEEDSESEPEGEEEEDDGAASE
ncbi:unnamed protein product [Caenorhabditis angaria]|uniref:GyrI-like small molecule binding domain-containing protein n=1 Tax=Caenorhabditis angaria TaxID=860376 RepID=A0A9P1MVL3_9PELO|nr:unnamed protein product [Caenorhabditis angaria]